MGKGKKGRGSPRRSGDKRKRDPSPPSEDFGDSEYSEEVSSKSEGLPVYACNAMNLGVEFFLLFTHQILALLSFLFPFRSFFPISNQYSDRCPCHV
jgi:hypothetical protein